MSDKTVTLMYCKVCNNTGYVFKGWRNKTTVILECTSCGNAIEVTGAALSNAMVNKQTVQSAASHLVGITFEAAKKLGKKSLSNTALDGGSDPLWKTINFRVMEDQLTIIRIALEALKLDMRKQGGRAWRGTALEFMAVGILQSLPDSVARKAIAIVEANEGRSPGDANSAFTGFAERINNLDAETGND